MSSASKTVLITESFLLALKLYNNRGFDMELSAEQELLVAKFRVEIDNRPFDVDPSGDEDWHSLAVGWAIGKGLQPEDARNFAQYIRYKTDLG